MSALVWMLVGLAGMSLELPASLAFIGAQDFASIGAKNMEGRRKVDALSIGGDPTGARDSAPAFAAAVASGGVSLSIPCGTYRLLANVPLPSDTEIVGAGDCTVFVIDPQMPANPLFTQALATNDYVRSAFSNADFAKGNRNIAIRNLRVTAPTPLSLGFYHAFAFYRADGVTLDDTTVEGAGSIHDGNHSIFMRSHDFRITNNRHTGGGNEGSIDVWDGSSDFLMANNHCDGGGRIQRCFTVNGISSSDVKAHLGAVGRTSSHGLITHNTAKNVKNVGVMIVGLFDKGPPPVYGRVEDIKVTDNVIEGVSAFHGIWIGEAENVIAARNVIRDAAGTCIYVASGGAEGKTSHVDLVDNQCIDSGKQAAIVIGNTSDAPEHLHLNKNRISYTTGGAPYAYDVLVRRDAADVQFVHGAMMAGNRGTTQGLEGGGN